MRFRKLMGTHIYKRYGFCIVDRYGIVIFQLSFNRKEFLIKIGG